MNTSSLIFIYSQNTVTLTSTTAFNLNILHTHIQNRESTNTMKGVNFRRCLFAQILHMITILKTVHLTENNVQFF